MTQRKQSTATATLTTNGAAWATGLTGRMTWTIVGQLSRRATTQAKHRAANRRELSTAVEVAFAAIIAE